MKNSRHSKIPDVNSGPMADIAFLLLIFFLVCTTISSDVGLKRQLAQPCPTGTDCTKMISENNLLRIFLNEKDELLVNDELIEITAFKDRIKDFIDNNADKSCSYCKGESASSDSDNPKKASLSLTINPQSTYDFYIKVEDEISKAYLELRTSYAKNVFGKNVTDLNAEELQSTKRAYPFNLADF